VKRGYGVGEKFSQDPVGSDESRGKNRERRKHKLDGPTLTPTESHIKNSLMRQFMKNPEGSEGRDESAYKSASCWCSGCDGKRLVVVAGLCATCASNNPILETPARLLGVDAETPRTP
jgi:hypothetical protein